jgi:fructosamine-3-kinase
MEVFYDLAARIMLTTSFLRQTESALGAKVGRKLHIRRVTPLSGGSINQSAKLETTAGIFFLKANDAFRYPGMFEKEAKGLQTLKEASEFTIPEVILTGEEEGLSFLILQFIEGRLRKSDFWESFGTSLAKMHRTTSARFGFPEDNYMGSLKQINTQHLRWVDFFIEERLTKQLKMALASGQLKTEDAEKFTRMFLKLDDLIPEEAPSLLHGDLWNGNFITGSEGEPCLIDPAVYFGHREVDLAMTRLFGGYDEAFYATYQAEFPLLPGFEERVDIHNLYPLLVHVNLFGGGYAGQVRSILRRYS